MDLKVIQEGKKILHEIEYAFYDLSPVKPNIHYKLKSRCCDQMEKMMKEKRKAKMGSVKKYRDSFFFGMDVEKLTYTIEEI